MKNLSKLELIEKVAQLESQISLLKNASSQTPKAIKDPLPYEQLENQIAALKTQNEILQQSEDELREVFQNMRSGVSFYDVIANGNDFIFCEINKAGEAIANVKKSDIIGKSLYEVRPNIEEYGLTDVFRKVWKTGKPEILDDKFYDDEKLTGYFKNFVYKSSTGKIVAIFEDLTEGKQAVQELKTAKEKAEESERKFRTLFETIPIGITLANENGQIISSNPAAEKILGLTKEEQLQRSIDGVEWSIIRPDGTVMPPEEYASTRALKEQQPIFNIEMGITKEINKVAWINVNAAPIKDYGVVISYEDVTERKQAEIELLKAKEKAQESQKQFMALFEQSPLSIQIFNFNGIAINVNRAWRELWQVPIDYEIINKYNLFEDKHAKERGWLDYLVKAFEGETVHIPDMKYDPQQSGNLGRKRILQATAFPIIMNKKVENVVLIHQDVTERKIAEEEIQKITERLQIATGTANIGIWDLDITNNILIWDNAMYNLYGISPDTFSGAYEAWEAGLHPEDLARGSEELQMALRGEKEFDTEFRVVWPDKSVHHIKATGIVHYDSKGKAIRMLGTNIDVTERKKQENIIKQQNEELHSLSTELETIIDTIPGLVFYKDTNNRFIRINKFMCDAHKMSKDELEGVSLFDIYPKEIAEAYFEADLKVIESKKPILDIDEPWKTEGGLRWVNTSKIPNMDKDGNVVGIIGISMDVTERKKQENTIKQQNEDLTKLNADKDRFMRILAHDLRSPFNSLLGLLDFLAENIRNYDMDEVEKLLNLTNKSAQSTFALLEDLLLWSNSQSGKLPFEPQILSFSTICNEVIEKLQLTANTKNITINYVASDSVSIFADKNMLRTILRNLISNAIKFTHSKGEIHIYPEIKNKNVIVTVSDTGIGMTKEDQAKLFDFTNPITTKGTANEKGTGLGLLLCKEFVEKHDGKIRIESEVGKGSNFIFTLPLNSQKRTKK